MLRFFTGAREYTSPWATFFCVRDYIGHPWEMLSVLLTFTEGEGSPAPGR